jgi:hypothetical protein
MKGVKGLGTLGSPSGPAVHRVGATKEGETVVSLNKATSNPWRRVGDQTFSLVSTWKITMPAGPVSVPRTSRSSQFLLASIREAMTKRAL